MSSVLGEGAPSGVASRPPTGSPRAGSIRKGLPSFSSRMPRLPRLPSTVLIGPLMCSLVPLMNQSLKVRSQNPFERSASSSACSTLPSPAAAFVLPLLLIEFFPSVQAVSAVPQPQLPYSQALPQDHASPPIFSQKLSCHFTGFSETSFRHEFFSETHSIIG